MRRLAFFTPRSGTRLLAGALLVATLVATLALPAAAQRPPPRPEFARVGLLYSEASGGEFVPYELPHLRALGNVAAFEVQSEVLPGRGQLDVWLSSIQNFLETPRTMNVLYLSGHGGGRFVGNVDMIPALQRVDQVAQATGQDVIVVGDACYSGNICVQLEGANWPFDPNTPGGVRAFISSSEVNRLSWSPRLAAFFNHVEENFDTVDVNGDSALSLRELEGPLRENGFRIAYHPADADRPMYYRQGTRAPTRLRVQCEELQSDRIIAHANLPGHYPEFKGVTAEEYRVGDTLVEHIRAEIAKESEVEERLVRFINVPGEDKSVCRVPGPFLEGARLPMVGDTPSFGGSGFPFGLGGGGGLGQTFMQLALFEALKRLLGFGRQQPATTPPPAPTQSAAPCPNTVQPVCGADGRTYPNRCVAVVQLGVPVRHPGRCPAGTEATPTPTPVASAPTANLFARAAGRAFSPTPVEYVARLLASVVLRLLAP